MEVRQAREDMTGAPSAAGDAFKSHRQNLQLVNLI